MTWTRTAGELRALVPRHVDNFRVIRVYKLTKCSLELESGCGRLEFQVRRARVEVTSHVTSLTGPGGIRVVTMNHLQIQLAGGELELEEIQSWQCCQCSARHSGTVTRDSDSFCIL